MNNCFTTIYISLHQGRILNCLSIYIIDKTKLNYKGDIKLNKIAW